MFLPRQQHFLQRWLLQVRTEKTFILILLSRQNCSQWKSILFYVPHLHFTFSADLTRKLMFCTKVARKDFTKTKLPSRALSVSVLMYSYLYFQPIEDSIWLFLSAHPVLAMFVPSLVTRDWDYPLTLPDIPSIMRHEACDAPHMQLPADQQTAIKYEFLFPASFLFACTLMR